jgi:hydroxypyruvate reductase
MLEAFRCAVSAAAPAICLPPATADLPGRDALVLGAGKAAASMAVAFAASAAGRVRGLVVTRYGHGLADGEDSGGVEVVEAGHPVPDASSLAAGRRLLALAATAAPAETVVFLASGGGSALCVVPARGVELEQKRDATDFLMRRGAHIGEINCVRRHLSGIKGGRLARAAHPAPVVTLAISDIPGDRLYDIGSGPTIPDPTTQHEALRVLARYQYPRITALEPILSDPELESPKPGDADFAGDSAIIIASATTALDAAERMLQGAGFDVRRLGDDLESEARQLGREHARLALETAREGSGVALLSGGETRVVVEGSGGRGGRNLEYLAGLALELDGHPGIFALAADTDGIDGSAAEAGGIATPDLLEIGRAAGLDLGHLLAINDTHRYFHACKLLVETGPTRTNVNDFRVILVAPCQ